MIGHGVMRGGGGGRLNRLSQYQNEQPTRKADLKTMRRVAASFKPYRNEVGIVLAAIVLVGALGIVNPYMLKFAISIGFARQYFRLLALFVGVMIATPIITGLIGIGQTWLNTRIGQSVMRDLRNQLYG
ncbi:MAG TPA: ABC transporter ATP-binding protein, partial [Ktedonobacterales bacterium]|nr:ABC transporter ATP-binding protein [Ktedonobacterales bacterium]